MRVEAGRPAAGQAVSTLMACDPERMEREAWLVAFRGAGPRWSLSGPGLPLTCGAARMELTEVPPVEGTGGPPAPREGTATRMACPRELQCQDEWRTGPLTDDPGYRRTGAAPTLARGSTEIAPVTRPAR